MDKWVWRHCLQRREVRFGLQARYWLTEVDMYQKVRITVKDGKPGWDASQLRSQPKAPTTLNLV